MIKNNPSLKGPKGDAGPQGPQGVSGQVNDSPCTPTSGKCRIFVTLTRVEGDMNPVSDPYVFGNQGNGLNGADRICELEGNRRFGTGITWRAWLSTNTVDARDRINFNSQKIYVTEVYQTVADRNLLLTAFHIGPITPSPVGFAWTGTQSDGTEDAGLTCNNWQSNNVGDTGRHGSTSNPAGWTSSAFPPACNQSLPLYCFETGA